MQERRGARFGAVKLVFTDEAWEDALLWQKQDKRMMERINKLIREMQRAPFTGVGKPEPLKQPCRVIGRDASLTNSAWFTGSTGMRC